MEDPRLANIRAAYARRTELADLYDPLLTPNVRMRLERTRIQAALIRRWLGPSRLSDMDVLEIGCGTGDNILSLIALGADPHRIVGNELLDERLEIAARRLPSAVRLHLGDGARLPDSYGSFDLIMQFVVFSSILDDPLLSSLASRIWNMLRPGGIILSYDMAVGNPFNPDVRGVPLRKLKDAFSRWGVYCEAFDRRAALGAHCRRQTISAAGGYAFFKNPLPLRNSQVAIG